MADHDDHVEGTQVEELQIVDERADGVVLLHDALLHEHERENEQVGALAFHDHGASFLPQVQDEPAKAEERSVLASSNQPQDLALILFHSVSPPLSRSIAFLPM
mmetsp:Transcript_4355/g.6296  ORF Transcript_4355/g.6296 Transcript_4355/m.6296 type:complete len:104 (+) Transcript_4355:604-915(+)